MTYSTWQDTVWVRGHYRHNNARGYYWVRSYTRHLPRP